MKQLGNEKLLRKEAYVNGQWQSAEKRFSVCNPFDGSEVAQVADLTTEDCRAAISHAHEAFKLWRAFSASKRAKIMKAWFGLLVQHADDLAAILCEEQGKPLTEAKGEVLYGASYVEWFAEEARRVYGDVIPAHGRDVRIKVIKQPVGVVAAITPWNFPSAMITRKIAPALAAGCTVVIKPSELTPLSALALAELADQAGFPAGVINVLTSANPQAIGEEMTSNPLVKKVSFTGSTEVGKSLLKQSADTVKRVSMELGGNAPFIVFDDADIDEAVKGAVASKFRNAGQTCICSNRLFVHADIYEAFIEKFMKAVQALRIGDGRVAGTDVGPLIEKSAVDFVNSLIRDAQDKGAHVLVGGRCAADAELLFEPTILTEVRRDMRLFSEEIFGPVAPVFKFSSEEDVISLANDTHYGLAAYFYGRDHARIWRVAEALEFGMVGINTGMISTPVAPFGGIKESGFGREGSKYGMDDFLNIKYMCWGGLQ